MSEPIDREEPTASHTSSIAEHYDNHLGPIYEWMAGDFEALAETMATYFRQFPLQSVKSKTAIDLGCGHGVQAIPLARLGLSVVAIDGCHLLLESLDRRAGSLPIRTECRDLCDFASLLDTQPGVIVCMGDTLTHLGSDRLVDKLIQSVGNSLCMGGWFCLSFRDYTSPLEGPARFIPVRSDENRIHTCFLEYGTDHVFVSDVVHERTAGGWKMSVSTYPKLRLPPERVLKRAAACGLSLRNRHTEKGMCYFAFERVE